MNEKDGGAAFPDHAVGHVREPLGSADGNLSFRLHGGMSLRDYFAGQALVGVCGGEMWPMDADAPEIARRAYVLADAMLTARES